MRAAVSILSLLAIEGSGTIHMQKGDICVNGLIPPPPNTGPFTQRFTQDVEGVRGYPFASTEARLIIDPLTSSFVGVHGIGGFGWIWEKDIPFALAGLGVRVGRGIWRGVLNVELWWLDVPFRSIEQNFFDGELVSEIEIEESSSENPVSLRVGIEFFP